MTDSAEPVEVPGLRLDAGDLAQGWSALYADWAATAQPLGRRLAARLAAGATVFPPDPLRALRLTPLTGVRVVILGQDPYHGAGQAEGLAFSVPVGMRPPPSLRNVLTELTRDLGPAALPALGGSLLPWAQRGVLLLNTVLTVEEGQPAAHAGWGWEGLTSRVIQACAEHPAPKVFMLWGAQAQVKRPLIDAAGRGHLVLEANHPSPLSARRPPRPFLGCAHFSQAQAWLHARGVEGPWC